MERININGTPAAASVYQLDDGRIYRVHLSLITQEAQFGVADYIEIETRGYEIDSTGAFILDTNGEPKVLKPQRARIPLGNIRAGIDTVKPGWVTVPEELTGEVPENDAEALPATGTEGDQVRVDGVLYRYTLGLYEACRAMRVKDVPPLPVPVDPALAASLQP